MKFIEWLYTDSSGQPYRTLFHCANGDLPVIIIMTVLLLIVVFQYSIVARYTYMTSLKYENSDVRKYLLYFNFVFIFCAIAGYGYSLLALFIQAYKIRILILGGLIFVTDQFIKYMKRSKSIDSILKAAKNYDESLQLLENKIDSKLSEIKQ